MIEAELQTPAPRRRGFDTLLDAGLSPADVANMRRQFYESRGEEVPDGLERDDLGMCDPFILDVSLRGAKDLVCAGPDHDQRRLAGLRSLSIVVRPACIRIERNQNHLHTDS